MKRNPLRTILLAVIFVLSAGLICVSIPFAKSPDASPSSGLTSDTAKKRSGSGRHMGGRRGGYLSPEDVPDSAVLIPPPPEEGSAAMAHDEEVSRAYLKMRDTPRWDQAARDAEFVFPDAFYPFSCIIGVPITETDTPVLYKMLRRVALDAGMSTRRAKIKYMRPRPFLINNEPICTPNHKSGLTVNGSYPSGHTAVGWAWALILAEVAPDKADAVIARGRAFGESRMACNVHWQSDVNEGRFMAAATVARLHGEAAFRADVETARGEIAAVRKKGAKPACDCSKHQ